MQRRIVHLANPRANLRNKICMHRSFHVFRPKVNRNLMPRGENRVKIPRTGMYKINTPFGANKKYVWDILNYLRHISNYVGHISNYVGHIFYPLQTRMKTKVSPADKYGHADLVCRGCANHGNSSCRVMPPISARLVRPCAFVRYLCKNMKVFEKLSYFSISSYICNMKLRKECNLLEMSVG